MIPTWNLYSGVFNLIQTNLFNLFYLSNPFRRRNKLYHSFSSCNSFKCMKHILGFVSKLFKKCNLIMFVMLNIRYFHRSSIIWFINSLFPKNMLTLFFAVTSLVSHHRTRKMSSKQLLIKTIRRFTRKYEIPNISLF